MGIVHAEITLKNAADVLDVQRGLKREDEVRSLVVNAIVDTGAGTLVINEEVSRKLGLNVETVRQSTLADGTKHIYKQMQPVRVYYENRDSICRPTMVPGADEVLLGAIPMEDMDLIVDPTKEALVGRHGDEIVMMLKKAG
jgi:clan AA aspartic protease